jgi:serine/threonine-protein kinase
MMGTPAFMAPEQALGSTADIGPHTDVWAVGATLFTLLTGRFVHDARTNNEALVFAATRPAPKLLDAAPEIPRVLAGAVDRALSFDRAARFADAGAMKLALGEALAILSPEGRAVAPAPSPSETLPLDDTDVQNRPELPVPQLQPTPAQYVVRPSSPDLSQPKNSPKAMSVDEVLGPTVASGQGPPAATPPGPTTTMGLSSDRAGIARARRGTRLRLAAVGVSLVAAGGAVAWIAAPGRSASPPAASIAPAVAVSPVASPSVATPEPAHAPVIESSSASSAPPTPPAPSAGHRLITPPPARPTPAPRVDPLDRQ